MIAAQGDFGSVSLPTLQAGQVRRLAQLCVIGGMPTESPCSYDTATAQDSGGSARQRQGVIRKKGPGRMAGPLFRGNEPVLIPMYAKDSWRPPPSRPFLYLLRSLVYPSLRCLVQALLDLFPVVATHFLTSTSQRCQGRDPLRLPEPPPPVKPGHRPALDSRGRRSTSPNTRMV